MMQTNDAIVARMMTSRTRGTKIPPLSDDEPLSLNRGYQIQDEYRATLLAQGKTLVGWKLAATGPVGREALGVEEPIYGFLFPGCYDDGDTVSRGAFVDLHTEAEIAFRMGEALSGPGIEACDARRAIECGLPALELPDIPFTEIPPAADMIANSALGGAIMIGAPVDLAMDHNLVEEVIVFTRNGDHVSTTYGADIMDDPFNAVAWLANRLGAKGETLKPGDIVMTGGISTLIRPDGGDTVEALFSSLGRITMKVVD